MKQAIIYTLLLLTGTCIAGRASAQYTTLSLPENMKQNASMIVRLDETTIAFKDKSSYTVTHKYAYTVLTPAGDKYATLVMHYDKLSKVLDIDATLYNSLGFKIRSLKKNEVKDYSNTDESNLADDDRVKVHSFDYHAYPYTVEYETKEERSGSFALPNWMPVKDEGIAVEKSSFVIQTLPEYKLRYKAFNYKGEPEVSTVKNTQVYKWELRNFEAITEESWSPDWHEITPTVFVAPSSFELQKFAGSMNSWKEFGQFIYKLNENRDQLPEKTKQDVHRLTDKLASTPEKVNALYKYLQNNTRYISIQLGIGGWQTLDANFVANNGYGDCKALNNYMYALLKEAGVKSYYTLVYAGSGKHLSIPDFTSIQFNHVILCVPQPKDTIWLECTNQKISTGYLGAFTSNRPVLLISEEGGTYTRTPAYNKVDNLQTRLVKAVLDAEGTLTAKVNTMYRGEQQDGLSSMINQSSQNDIDDYMKHRFSLASYQIDQFKHETVNENLPAINESIALSAKNYAAISGKRLFVNPNVLSVSHLSFKNPEKRKFDFNLYYSFTDRDTVEIAIPAGYTPESVPQNISLEMPLAQYQSTVKIEPGKILYIRTYSQTGGRIPVTEAKTVSAFFEKITKADNAKIVFVKNEN